MLRPQFQMILQTRRRCSRVLAKICGEYAILPNSYVIPQSKILKLGKFPTSSNDLSDAWPGMYEEVNSVAIRVLRCQKSGDVRGVRRVRRFDLFSSSRQIVTIYRNSAERS